jgi:hypothetical protein
MIWNRGGENRGNSSQAPFNFLDVDHICRTKASVWLRIAGVIEFDYEHRLWGWFWQPGQWGE